MLIILFLSEICENKLGCELHFASCSSLSHITRWRLLRKLIAPTSFPVPCQSAPKTKWPSSLPTSKTGTSWCRGSQTSYSRPLLKSTLSGKSQAASAAQTTRWEQHCLFVCVYVYICSCCVLCCPLCAGVLAAGQCSVMQSSVQRSRLWGREWEAVQSQW